MSAGVTPTERVLAQFCERSFLKLWSYANPRKDDGHELCDLLAVFGDQVFIFFDRESVLPTTSEKDPQVLWDRWRRNVIDRQIKTAHGAERYIRDGRAIFLDAACTTPFPLTVDPAKAVFHKIIIAHGAKDACLQASAENVYGSLAISYTDTSGGSTRPFHVEIDKTRPVHIFDSHNMSIVLAELDTVTDLAAYLCEKVRATTQYDVLQYCGEEDLLAHYLLNFDKGEMRHVIGRVGGGEKVENDRNATSVWIGEGEWRDFIETDLYQHTKQVNRVSYFWDALIQRTCQNYLDGILGGNSKIAQGQSAIFEMVKEPRFMRRALAEKMLTAVQRFPDTGEFTRQVTFLPSFQPNVAYVLLQLRIPANLQAMPDMRERRQMILEIACGAAKNKFPHLQKVIGIGIEAPKFSRQVAEDFILMPCAEWTDEMRTHYETLNSDWDFFKTPHLQEYKETVTQFVHPPDGVAPS